MTREELREKVANAIEQALLTARIDPLPYGPEADAAIAIVLEEAAKVADEHEDDMGHGKGAKIAAAIRALKG